MESFVRCVREREGGAEETTDSWDGVRSHLIARTKKERISGMLVSPVYTWLEIWSLDLYPSTT